MVLAQVADSLLTGGVIGGVLIGFQVAATLYKAKRQRNGNGESLKVTCENCPIGTAMTDHFEVLKSNHRRLREVQSDNAIIKEGMRDLLEALRLEAEMRKMNHASMMDAVKEGH